MCYRTDVVNRTSSAPNSVLRYVLDKGQYFNLVFCLYPILYPNKEADRQWRVKFANSLRSQGDNQKAGGRHQNYAQNLDGWLRGELK